MDQIISRALMLLGSPDTTRSTFGGPDVDSTFELMPSDFLAFAEKDLQTELTHKYVNAFANAKRALDCQADRILKILGFYEESQSNYWGFPTKLETLKKFGILAPRILNKINQQRNLLEHKFISPDVEKVTDFIDVVALFIASTEKYILGFPIQCTYTYNGDVNDSKDLSLNISFDEFDLIFDVSTKSATVSIIDFENFAKSMGEGEIKHVTSKVSFPEDAYISFVKHHLTKISFL